MLRRPFGRSSNPCPIARSFSRFPWLLLHYIPSPSTLLDSFAPPLPSPRRAHPSLGPWAPSSLRSSARRAGRSPSRDPKKAPRTTWPSDHTRARAAAFGGPSSTSRDSHGRRAQLPRHTPAASQSLGLTPQAVAPADIAAGPAPALHALAINPPCAQDRPAPARALRTPRHCSIAFASRPPRAHGSPHHKGPPAWFSTTRAAP